MRAYKIFIIDDDPELVSSLKDFLELRGYHIFTATNGLTAKVMINTHKPDLLILDIDMPVMNGIDLLEHVRSTPEGQTLPVIVLTGVSSAIVSPALEGKAYLSHIKKPVEPNDLLSLLKHYLPESV